MEYVAMTVFGVTFATLFIIPFIVVWILIAFLPANIAKNKGRNFWLWFLLSLFFWWITLFVALLLPDQHAVPTPPATPPSEE